MSSDVANNGCTDDPAHTGHATGVSLTPQHSLTISVPAKSGGTNGTTTQTLAGAVSMTNSSDTGCQGAIFTIPVTVSSHS